MPLLQSSMLRESTVRCVQQKLNRLSLYVLSCIMVECHKHPNRAFGDGFYQQALLAMSPEFDPGRLDNAASFEAVKTLGNGEWL